MGLFSPFKSLFKKNERERSREREERESKEASSTAQNVSTGAESAVSAQEMMKSRENLQVIDEKEILWEINKKLDELGEIKDLYKDMLDWMVEISKKEDIEGNREGSRQISKESNLSPRLRQVLEIVKEKGEVNSSKLSEELDLSKNRCSELLNALFKANYLSKKRVGRKVFYRVNSTGSGLEGLE